MKKLLMVVMACYALNARAQEHESKNFIYLYSDSMIYAKKITLRPDFSGYWQLRVDSRRVPAEQVKFFSNDNGFFANTRRQTFGATAEFSERIIEGKINLFQQITYDPFVYQRGYRYHRRSPQPVVDVRMYYNKGFDDLKKVNYNNLNRDMADNAESMDMLASYRKSMNASKILYISAGVSMVAGFVSFLAQGNSRKLTKTGFSGKSPNFTGSFLLLGLGAGVAVGGYAIQVSGSRHLENAIDAYNR